jgi:hypothetical protein
MLVALAAFALAGPAIASDPMPKLFATLAPGDGTTITFTTALCAGPCAERQPHCSKSQVAYATDSSGVIVGRGCWTERDDFVLVNFEGQPARQFSKAAAELTPAMREWRARNR